MIIAVDGPAAAGKGTLARALAAHFGFAYLDTGALYRGVAHAVLKSGASASDEAAALLAAETLNPDQIDPKAIRTPEVSEAASLVAAMPPVRAAILAFQRRFASHPPGDQSGTILDGRDIGTVVCPEADVKLYVTASPEVRAHRRWLELKGSGSGPSEAQVLEDVQARDVRDTDRKTSPMRPAADAHLLDTSDLSIEAAFDVAVALIETSRG
ncbi:MAG: cytidylate kinase [Rhodobiaceae bacterium]|nr:MAG: cytidylate kinase [Rhodobiaceae bacterium]